MRVSRSVSSPPAMVPSLEIFRASNENQSLQQQTTAASTKALGGNGNTLSGDGFLGSRGRVRHNSLFSSSTGVTKVLPRTGSRSFCGGGGVGTGGNADEHLQPDTLLSPAMPEMSPKGDTSYSTVEGGGGSSSKMGKRESYKVQRKNYCREKKRVAKELMTTLKDPSIIVMADWLKVRGTLKGWTKFWCVLKPGLLLLYKTPKTHKGSHWIGTVLLNSCEVIERPSKKDGFCFKLFHPLEQSIWASRGNHTMALMQPLPMNYLIFRAPSEPAGKCWMDALELALRCTSLLMRTLSGGPKVFQAATPEHASQSNNNTLVVPAGAVGDEELTPQHQSQHHHRHSNHWNDSDLEKHFKDHDLDDDTQTDDTQTDDTRDGAHSLRSTDSDSEPGPEEEDDEDEDLEPVETPYVENGTEEFGIAGDAGQTEEVAEENKSLIWSLVKQVRPGMDLSRVVLPTFILEPRSFLDKLSDYYYHADILSKAVQEDDPFTRMKLVSQWYLSGFYKKPKGLKKPYNPILGETFRCYWKHSAGSRTFYISEQVSHHPPVSAFFVTNRQDGFCISGSILAKSKFYGNSLSAILDGTAYLTLLTRGEVYTLTMPYAHCKGILMGTLTMELGGKVSIACEKTGYRTDLEFKLKPFLGGPELCNVVSGKVRLGKEILATIEGHWDGEIFFKDKRSGEEHLYWSAGPETRNSRLKRFTVPLEVQGETESERLWQHVSLAIARLDQIAATEEKTLLEDSQRNAAKERQAKMEKWIPHFFLQDILSGDWLYKHIDSRPWDPRNDLIQYEQDYIIRTKTRHRTPIVRTGSIVSMEEHHHRHRHPRHSLDIRHHHVSVERALAVAASRQHLVKSQGSGAGRIPSLTSHGSESSSPDGIIHGSDSTESEGPLGSELLGCPVENGTSSLKVVHGPHPVKKKGPAATKLAPSSPKVSIHQLQEVLRPQQKILEETQQVLSTLQHHIESLLAQQRRIGEQLANRSDLTLFFAILVLQVLVQAFSHWWWNSAR